MIVTTYFGKKQGLKFSAGSGGGSESRYFRPKNIWLILLVIGILASAQQIFMASSHKYASASGLAPIHYANIPIGVFIGILVFNETIGINFFIGSALIVGSTLFIIYREKTLGKD